MFFVRSMFYSFNLEERNRSLNKAQFPRKTKFWLVCISCIHVHLGTPKAPLFSVINLTSTLCPNLSKEVKIIISASSVAPPFSFRVTHKLQGACTVPGCWGTERRGLVFLSAMDLGIHKEPQHPTWALVTGLTHWTNFAWFLPTRPHRV